MAQLGHLWPFIKTQYLNSGGEPSARRSRALLCSHVSEQARCSPVSWRDEQRQADCVNRSSWLLHSFVDPRGIRVITGNTAGVNLLKKLSIESKDAVLSIHA